MEATVYFRYGQSLVCDLRKTNWNYNMQNKDKNINFCPEGVDTF